MGIVEPLRIHEWGGGVRKGFGVEDKQLLTQRRDLQEGRGTVVEKKLREASRVLCAHC